MKINNNGLCSCGSGKKYKNCCGSGTAVSLSRPDYVAINRAVAYVGAVGERRKTFCEQYIDFKRGKISGIQDTLVRDVESKKLVISCFQGCSYCCSQFVVASLQEAEGIAYYLYQNENVFKHFINAYPVWLTRIKEIERCFNELNRLCGIINSGKATNEDIQGFNAAGRIYTAFDNPCPFLIEKACSIYRVRPFVCANYFSVTPPEWCRASNPGHKNAVHVKIKLLGKDLPYFIPLPKNRIVYPVPLLVHRLLEEGYGALCSITGNPGLKRELLGDPLMRAALRKALA